NALLAKMKRPSRKHQPLVMLPQAFGPFVSQGIAKTMRDLLQRATLVYARDRVSQQYLQDLNSPKEIHLCPDFTLSEAPREADIELPPGNFAAIVPNARMLDKYESPADYLEFLDKLIGLLPQFGLQPVFLLHDAAED